MSEMMSPTLQQFCLIFSLETWIVDRIFNDQVWWCVLYKTLSSHRYSASCFQIFLMSVLDKLPVLCLKVSADAFQVIEVILSRWTCIELSPISVAQLDFFHRSRDSSSLSIVERVCNFFFNQPKFQFSCLKFSDATYLNLTTVCEKHNVSISSKLKMINQTNIIVNSYQVLLLTIFNISDGYRNKQGQFFRINSIVLSVQRRSSCPKNEVGFWWRIIALLVLLCVMLVLWRLSFSFSTLFSASWFLPQWSTCRQFSALWYWCPCFWL